MTIRDHAIQTAYSMLNGKKVVGTISDPFRKMPTGKKPKFKTIKRD